MKVFNTTAVCIPSENYMVDISDKLTQIVRLIEQKKYFAINKALIFYQAPLTFYYAAAISLTTIIHFFSICQGRLEIRLMGDCDRSD